MPRIGPARASRGLRGAVAVVVVLVVIGGLGLFGRSQMGREASRPGATASEAISTTPAPSAEATPGFAEPIAVGQPLGFLPECEGSRDPGPTAEAVAPVRGGVEFKAVARLGGPTSSTAVAGRFAFVGAGATIQVLDLEERSAEPVVASVQLPGYVTDLAVAGSRLAVATGEVGMVVLDIADPTVPTIEAVVQLPGYAEGVDVSGALAFVADGPGGLRIVELGAASGAGSAVVGSALDAHLVLDVAVSGSLAFLAAADEGLIVLDVSDPSAPVSLGSVPTDGYAFGVAIDATTAAVASGWGGVQIVDASRPESPRVRSIVPTAGWALDVTARDGSAYVAVAGDGLLVVDSTGPGAVTGRIPIGVGRAVHVALAGDRAFVANSRGEIHVVDVVDPDAPRELRTIGVLADALDAAPTDDGALVAGGAGGLWLLEGSDPGRLQPSGHVETTLILNDVIRLGRNVLTSGSGGPAGPENGIVSLTVDRRAVEPVGAYALGMPNFSGWNPAEAPVIQNGLVLYPEEVGVLIVDGTVLPPCIVGKLRTQAPGELEIGYVGGATVNGATGYLGVNADGIYVIDLSTPEFPVVVRTIPATAGVGNAILATRDALYAVDGKELVIFSLKDPRAPRRLGELDLPFETTRLAYAGGHLFLASQAAILAVDVSDPRAPRFVGRHDLPGQILRLTAVGDLLYAALGSDGFAVIRWTEGDGQDVAVEKELSDSLPARTSIGPGDGDRTTALATVDFPARPILPAATRNCVVTTTADAGSTSLRGCLALGPGTRVSFDPGVFPASRPATIDPDSVLEVPPDAVIDGREAGVILDGRGEIDAGLSLTGGAAVMGLHVRNFADVGISVAGHGNLVDHNVVAANGYIGIGVGGTGNWITGNRVGTNPAGTRSAGLQFVGVGVEGTGNVIGGPNESDSNLISGNQFGVDLTGKECGTRNIVAGNLIGTDVRGTKVVAPFVPDQSDGAGIGIRACGHVVAGNLLAATIEVVDFAEYNDLIGNRIGVDRRGRAFDCECGVAVYTPFNRIGGTLSGEGNVIRGFVSILSRDTFVLGNSLVAGVAVQDGGFHNVIGGRSIEGGNLLMGIDGVVLSDGARFNVIIGNNVRVRERAVRSGGPWRNYVVANAE